MRALDITKKNINEYGYFIGKSIRGKGTEILSGTHYVCGAWYLQEVPKENREKQIKELLEAIEKQGIENVYVEEIGIMESGKKKTLNFEGKHEESIEKFDLKKIIDLDFKDVDHICVYTRPKVLCVMPLTKYGSDFESQQEMLKTLMWKADKRQMIGDLLATSDEDVGSLIYFSEKYSNESDAWQHSGDYTLFHGPYTCLAPEEVLESIDCRVSNYNDSVIDEFWNVTMAEDPFIEVDPEERVSVYAYKGKTWYVTSGIDEDQIYFTYKGEDGELVEDEKFWFSAICAEDELVKKISRVVLDMHIEVETKGLISNELHIGNWSDASIYGDDYEYDEGLFNLEILNKEYEGRLEVRDEILDLIDWDGEGTVKFKVTQAYEKFLSSHMDKDEKLFGKYAHFVELRKIVEKEGKELVYTSVDGDVNNKQWAIRYKGEEYHFYLAELFNSDPKKFYEYVSNQLTKRINERIEMNELMKKAKYVFVGLDDSVKSGNCMSGTESFCERFGIDTNKIGGIRGDELLKLDYSPYTRQAVMQAIKREEV